MTSLAPSIALSSTPRPVLLGLKLPAVVDVDRTFPGLTEVEAQIERACVLRMHDIPCNRKLPVAATNYCGAYLSAGDYRQAVKLPKFMAMPGDAGWHSSAVPLSSLLAFTEGSLDKAHALIEQGVDFASAETLAPVRCGAVTTPEFVMAKPDYFPYMSPAAKAHRFKAAWDQLETEFVFATNVSSPRLGVLPLDTTHRISLARTLHRAHHLLHEKYLGDCLPRLRMVGAACRSVRANVVYGRAGAPYSFHMANIRQTILPNAGFPGEYFAALVSCPSAPTQILNM